ncbi:MFS transporter [Brevundimonas balnearis]|uniref:MFS transporter n=1 Tax=Brevundimonas balnearis TaxID=1572858 RepID=A0ABV6R1R3_9CAUL
MLGYLAAQTGAYVTFIPLLTLLLPLKAEAIAGSDKTLLLSQAAMIGGLVAAVANIAAGVLSDRTTGRMGRRRPWILGGLAMTAAALAAIAGASSPLALILSLSAFQVAVNALYGPLCALVPDLVPDDQKGLASAFASVALPLANLFTAVVVARWAGSEGLAFAAVAITAAALILPLALRLSEPETTGRPARLRFSLGAFRSPPYALAFVSRLFAETGVAVHTLYLLFLIQALPRAAAPAGWTAVEIFSLLMVTSTVSATAGALGAGALSDRVGRRAPFVIGGAVGMGAALAALVVLPRWPAPLLAQGLFGLCHGVHAATVAALTAEILPEPAHAGRDLGVMNVAIAMPQSLAPAAAAGLFVLGADLPIVFLASAVALGVAGLLLTPLTALSPRGRCRPRPSGRSRAR